MTRLQQVLWAIVIVVVLGGVYWLWSASQATPTPTISTTTSVQTEDTGTGGTSVSTGVSTGRALPTSATITYDGNSFSPANVTIAQGGTVTWVSTGTDMWVASDPHPLHNGYDGTTLSQHCAQGYLGAAPFDECSAGTTFSFTFEKVGTWGYHDHLSEENGGAVTVVAQ